MPAVFECRSTQYNPSIRRSLPGCDRAPRVVSANVYRQKASTRVAKNCWPRASLRNRVNEPDNSRESVYLWTIVGEGWAGARNVYARQIRTSGAEVEGSFTGESSSTGERYGGTY